jgi:hypothetical protein
MIRSTTPCGDGMVLDMRVMSDVREKLCSCVELLRIRVVTHADMRFTVSVSMTASAAKEPRSDEIDDVDEVMAFEEATPREKFLLRILADYSLSVKENRQIVTEVADFLNEHLGGDQRDKPDCVVNSFVSAASN